MKNGVTEAAGGRLGTKRSTRESPKDSAASGSAVTPTLQEDVVAILKSSRYTQSADDILNDLCKTWPLGRKKKIRKVSMKQLEDILHDLRDHGRAGFNDGWYYRHPEPPAPPPEPEPEPEKKLQKTLF